MSNRKLGNDFEQQLCEILFENGFWVHNLTQNKSGQPADIIAVKRGKAFLIDAKVCSNDSFKLSRIEENQLTAMEMWINCQNLIPWFAISINNVIVMISYGNIKEAIDRGKKELKFSDFINYGKTLDKWMSHIMSQVY